MDGYSFHSLVGGEERCDLMYSMLGYREGCSVGFGKLLYFRYEYVQVPSVRGINRLMLSMEMNDVYYNACMGT